MTEANGRGGTLDLTKYSRSELEQLQSRIKALLSVSGSNGSKQVNDVADDELLLSCMAAVLQEEFGDFPAMAMLRNAAKSTGFREKVGPLMRFFAKVSPQRSVQSALIKRGYRLLIEDMTNNGYLMSPRTLLAHSHRLPSILNRAYPGYARAGMLDWVVTKAGRGHKPNE